MSGTHAEKKKQPEPQPEVFRDWAIYARTNPGEKSRRQFFPARRGYEVRNPNRQENILMSLDNLQKVFA
jgi:hypothetical protein